MLKLIHNILKRISMVGVDESLTVDLSRKIRLANICAFFMAFMVAAAGAISFPFQENYKDLNIVRIFLGGIYSFPIFLNYFGLYSTSRFYVIVSPAIALTLIAAVIGAEPATSLKVALMPAILLPIVLFGVTERKKMVVGMVMVVGALGFIDLIASIMPLHPGTPEDLFSNNIEVNINVVISLVLFIIAFIVYQIILKQTEESLREEHSRAEELLQNILPREIIPILKESPEVIAENFEETSILFADIVNFTPLAARKGAQEIVRILNSVFSYFDSIVEKYDVEKIKTIGDCYMVAAGVPRDNEEHAKILVKIALEFRNYIEMTPFEGELLDLRIGISSGPVVAGVIGKKKFIYDLWGDTVNTASRMESHGRAGEIQITEETKKRIDDEFECEKQADIEVKGKGKMAIYTVKSTNKLSKRIPSSREKW